MDEKSAHRVPSPAITHPENMICKTLNRPSRRAIYPFLLAITITSFFLYQTYPFISPIPFLLPSTAPLHALPSSSSSRVKASLKSNTTRVPLEAHIMSKCPDAKDCLRNFIVPAMENISEKVDFRLSFIGDIAPDDSISCKHGPTECLGDIFSLCASTLYPNSTLISLGFSTCMISSYASIPSRSLIESCALEHGVDFGLLNKCVSEDGRGLELLRDSVERSKDKGVVYSCTVRLDDKIRCIRDGGVWKECEAGSAAGDLVGDVESLFREFNQV